MNFAPFSTTGFHGMPYRYLGNSGLQVPAMGLGTWKFGYPDQGDGSRVDEPTAFEIFDKSVELGVTLWDTANRYNGGSGNSERVIGRWLQANPEQRRNVIIATKVFGGMDGETPNHSGLSRGNIVDSVHACLQRLQLDYIDLLYFHRHDDDVPVEESLETVDDLVRQGLVRYFGVSNFTTAQLADYAEVQQGISARCRVAAVQNQYDPLHGEPAEFAGVLDYCARRAVGFVPYSPLAGGLLTERYLDPATVRSGDRLHDENQQVSDSDRQVVARVAELARKWDASVSELTLAYLLALPGMAAMIPASSTVEQLASNARAATIELSGEQMSALRSIFGN